MLVGVVVAALVVACAVVADWWETNREGDALLDQMESSQRDIRAANQDLADHMTGADAGDTEAYTQAQTGAMEASGEVAASRSQAEGLFVLPWHRSVDQARDAYVDYTKAWSAYFDDAATKTRAEWAADFKQLLLDVVTGWKVIETQLPEAVPPVPLHDVDGRVDAFLASGKSGG